MERRSVDSYADCRVTYASCTGPRKTLMGQIFPPHEKKRDEIFGQLTEADMNKMMVLLNKIG